MRRLRLLLGAALTAAVAVVACTLNPQPLPPSDFNPGSASDDASTKDGGQFGAPTAADAGATGNDREGGAADAATPPSADAGDVDAGDAAPDADAG
jgi:hypothetical protein